MGFEDFVGGVSYQKNFESGQNLMSLSKSLPPVSAPLAVQTLSETDSFLSADVMSPSGANQRDC